MGNATLISMITCGLHEDGETVAHLLRVSHCSQRLAQAAGLPSDAVADIAEAALLHHIGKIALPRWITLERGPLTSTERAIVQSHTEIGAEILSDSKSRFDSLARQVALRHHERWDGTGHPAGSFRSPISTRHCAASAHTNRRSRTPESARSCFAATNEPGRSTSIRHSSKSSTSTQICSPLFTPP